MATGSGGGRDWQDGGRRDGYNWSHKKKDIPGARGDCSRGGGEDRNRRGRGSPAYASGGGQGRGSGGQRHASDHRDCRGGHDSSMRNWTPRGRSCGQNQPAGGYQGPPGPAPQSQLRGGAPPRPGASEIDLVANHFAIEVRGGTVYHYDVAITSLRRAQGADAGAAQGAAGKAVPCLIARVNRQVIAVLESTNPTSFNSRPVFDGRSNLYTREKIRPDDRLDHNFVVTLTGDGRQRHYDVAIRFAAELNLDALRALYDRYDVRPVPQNAIQALDIIMRHGPCTTLTPVGRSLFADPEQEGEISLGATVTLRFGCYASVRPAEKTLMLNIDRSAMAFYKSPRVVKFMSDLLRERYTNFNLAQLTDGQLNMLSSELRAVRVRCTHRPIQYRVAEVTRLPARDITFTRTLADGTTQLVSVASYFEDRYPGKMKNKMLPCIRAGSLERPVYLPIEVCDIVEWQPYRKKLSASMTTIMIKKTAQPPSARFDDIQRYVRDLVDRGTPYLDGFGITVHTRATRLTGRLLSAPRLAFQADRAQEPRNGSWIVPTNGLLHAKPLDNWALLKCGCKPELNTGPLVAEFQRTGRDLGMRVVAPQAQEIAVVTRASISQQLTSLQKRFPKLSLVVVLLGERAPYAVIKEVAEVTLGIRTQCILEVNAGPDSHIKSIVKNLCLKINAKLGGVNNGLMGAERRQCFSDTLFIGADVTHPAPGDRDKPSIAACVGSMDDVPAQYRASIRIQMQSNEAVARVETITDLKVMVEELLKAYQTKMGKTPKEIVFYRDGVSEGQFSSMRSEELPAIQAACRAVALSMPAITFIVVQKRHHTRFKRGGGVDSQKNIPPGTVVDKVVTHPRDSDFFLCSHFGIQGTSRPARYVVLHDDKNHTLDFLQRLSYQLCHTYARCPRSVSIPAPVYYAHLAAFRAKEHITAACVSPRNYGKAVAVAEALQDVMYFV